MGLTPKGTSARQVGFENSESASVSGFHDGMRIAVLAKEQCRRDIGRSHPEYWISTLPTKRSRKARFRQVQRRIECNRHSALPWLDRTVLPNGEITGWAVDPNTKRATRAPDPRQPIRFRLHGSKHRLSGLAGVCILRSILK
jgi:hypothetical protein